MRFILGDKEMIKNRIVEGSERKRDKSQTSTPRPVIRPKPRPSIHYQVYEHEIIDLLRQILDDTGNGFALSDGKISCMNVDALNNTRPDINLPNYLMALSKLLKWAQKAKKAIKVAEGE
jgi:hypothetical protein